MEQRESSPQMVWGQLGIHVQKNESRHWPYTLHGVNSKWITDLNVKHKTVKLLEDNIRENLDDLVLVLETPNLLGWGLLGLLGWGLLGLLGLTET